MCIGRIFWGKMGCVMEIGRRLEIGYYNKYLRYMKFFENK